MKTELNFSITTINSYLPSLLSLLLINWSSLWAFLESSLDFSNHVRISFSIRDLHRFVVKREPWK